MANRNTRRKRATGEDGYGKKRGYALKTGFGQEHGSKTRKAPKTYRTGNKKKK